MSIILFIIGAGLLGVGAVKLGNIQLEGGRVRAAGIILMTPFVGYLLLFQIVSGLTGGDEAALGFVSVLEFGGIIASGAIAYMLLSRAPQKTRVTVLPKTRPISSTKADEKSTTPVESTSQPQPNQRAKPRPTHLRDYPTIMTTAEAAQYLNMTEQAVLELIEEGKLTAARINYRYRISRTVLDEFIKKHKN
ncbi:MAG: hypothetical protein CUN56_12560 [Phototrophicales bacterium]|nr:MAG: hypothetical protein CUN56_12560 [Phototrophicales bacterium]